MTLPSALLLRSRTVGPPDRRAHPQTVCFTAVTRRSLWAVAPRLSPARWPGLSWRLRRLQRVRAWRRSRLGVSCLAQGTLSCQVEVGHPTTTASFRGRRTRAAGLLCRMGFQWLLRRASVQCRRKRCRGLPVVRARRWWPTLEHGSRRPPQGPLGSRLDLPWF